MKTLIPLATEIAERLVARGETIAVSESSSGGLISAALLAVPGASAYYRGGGIIYTPSAFRGLMGLTRDDLGPMRSSSEPYACLMARTIRKRCRATWGLCETGASGPTGNGYGDAAGHTCIGVTRETDEQACTLETGISDREDNMFRFAHRALEYFHEVLQQAD